MDDLVQSLARPSLARAEEAAMIKDYFHYSPPLALEIVKQYNSLPNPQHLDNPETRPSARFVRFYRINYPKVRKLNPKIALPIIQTIGETTPDDWFLNQDLIDVATKLDQLVGERISLEGKTGLLYFLRQLVQDGLKPWESNLTLLFETYREWSELQKPPEKVWPWQLEKMAELTYSEPRDKEAWIYLLLSRLAQAYSLPVPNERGELHRDYRNDGREELPTRVILKGLWTVRELCRYYNQYCAARPDFPFPIRESVSFVFSYMKVSDPKEAMPDEDTPVLDEGNIKTVEKVFGLFGQCQTLDEIKACAALNIPGYRISRKLGQGVYKEVYRGMNEISGGERALKIINVSERGLANLEKKGLTLEQCVKEEAKKSEAVAKIGNPHLAQMYEIKQEPTLNDKYVISEELLERTIEELMKSGKLAGQLEAEKYFSKLRLSSYLNQIANGLAALHRHGFVHGDLTLSNIGIKEGKIKIIDFGLASTIGNVAYETGERINVGSILTRAPELFEGEKITDKADVWSFGIVAYMAATGKYPPFIPAKPKPAELGAERENYEKEVQQRIRAMNLLAMVDVPEIPSRLRKILRRCLQLDPKERIAMDEAYRQLSNPRNSTIQKIVHTCKQWIEYYKAKPRNLVHTYYSEKCEQWIEYYKTKKEGEPWWLPFPRKKLEQFDYIFVANKQEDLLTYQKTLSVEQALIKNPSLVLPERVLVYHHGLSTTEKRREEKRTKSPGLGVFDYSPFLVSPFYSTLQHHLMYNEGLDQWGKGLQKKVLLLSYPSHKQELEDDNKSFPVEEIDLEESKK